MLSRLSVVALHTKETYRCVNALHSSINSVYLLFIGIYRLHVDLQFPSQLFKSPRPVLVLSVPILNGLTQPLEHTRIEVNVDGYSPFKTLKVSEPQSSSVGCQSTFLVVT